MSINKEEAAFMIEAIALWVNTVFEVADVVEDRQQICTYLLSVMYLITKV